MTASRSKVFFGLAKTDRVQVRVFDVSGRLVRTLADRTFQAGNHSIEWDGTADNGARVARGVYFTQVSSKTYTSAQKLTVLQ
jgi:flagellar hook assembly protein FlgD